MAVGAVAVIAAVAVVVPLNRIRAIDQIGLMNLRCNRNQFLAWFCLNMRVPSLKQKEEPPASVSFSRHVLISGDGFSIVSDDVLRYDIEKSHRIRIFSDRDGFRTI